MEANQNFDSYQIWKHTDFGVFNVDNLTQNAKFLKPGKGNSKNKFFEEPLVWADIGPEELEQQK